MEPSVGNKQWRGEVLEALFCWVFLIGGALVLWSSMGEGWGGESRKSYLYIRSWCYLKKWECGISPTRSLVFAHSWTFHHHRSYRRNLRSQCQLNYWVHEYFSQNNPPVPSKIHRLLPSYKPLQQMSIPLNPAPNKNNPKRKNSTPKPYLQGPPAQHPWPHNPPQPRHPLSHWNVKAPSKSQNPQTNQKIISTTSQVTFTYPLTLQQPPPRKQMTLFTFPTIFSERL